MFVFAKLRDGPGTKKCKDPKDTERRFNERLINFLIGLSGTLYEYSRTTSNTSTVSHFGKQWKWLLRISTTSYVLQINVWRHLLKKKKYVLCISIVAYLAKYFFATCTSAKAVSKGTHKKISLKLYGTSIIIIKVYQ